LVAAAALGEVAHAVVTSVTAPVVPEAAVITEAPKSLLVTASISLERPLTLSNHPALSVVAAEASGVMNKLTFQVVAAARILALVVVVVVVAVLLVVAVVLAVANILVVVVLVEVPVV
jgi:hypothetical protein